MGLYQLILPVYSVLLSLTSVGLTTGVSNLSAWYQALGNQRVIDQVRGQAVKLFLLLALGPCGLLLLFSDGVSVYLLGDARTRLGLMLLVPCLVLTGIENLQKHYFYGTGRVCPAAVDGAHRADPPVGAGAGPGVGHHSATAEEAVGAIVLGMALCEVTSALTQTVLFRRYLGPRDRLAGAPLPPSTVRRKLGRIALPLGLAALLGNGISSANAVLIPPAAGAGGHGPEPSGVHLRGDLRHDPAHAPAAHGLSQRPGGWCSPAQALPVRRPAARRGRSAGWSAGG